MHVLVSTCHRVSACWLESSDAHCVLYCGVSLVLTQPAVTSQLCHWPVSCTDPACTHLLAVACCTSLAETIQHTKPSIGKLVLSSYCLIIKALPAGVWHVLGAMKGSGSELAGASARLVIFPKSSLNGEVWFIA
jgi:hypothetical protein